MSNSKVLSLCAAGECKQNFSNVFLQTARVFISAPSKTSRLFVRIIIDGGSQRTYIRQAVANRLKLPVSGHVNLNVIPFGKSELSDCKQFEMVKVLMTSQYGNRCIELVAIVVPEICIDVLAAPESESLQLNGLKLADSNSVSCGQEEGLSILLGADYYWAVASGKYKRITNSLTAVGTIFGWTIQGPDTVSGETSENIASLCSLSFVDNMWNLELLGIKTNDNELKSLTAELQVKYISKTETRYLAALPWKNADALISDNREIALSRLRSLVRKLSREQQRLFEYDKTMRDFISAGFAEPAPADVTKGAYYMPHRPVYRPERATTKVRIVFDVSSHAEGVPSLNECLWTGTNLLPDVFKILLRFRMGRVAVSADIEKAFLQILLEKGDRDYHRFIWFSDKLQSTTEFPVLNEFRMCTVTFGVKCSPFLLSATIQMHLDAEKESFPETCTISRDSFYMDDLLVSVDDEESGERFRKEATKVMARAHMNLRKWLSNEKRLSDSETESDSGTHSILGVKWNVSSDELSINIDPDKLKFAAVASKRNILKLIAGIYDPLGFLCPVTIRLKILFQSLWRQKLDWDETLSAEFSKEWYSSVNNFEDIKNQSLSRWVGITTDSRTNEVHIFADASSKAFGAVAFIRTVSHLDMRVQFLCAKSRVAPLKENKSDDLSLPKLELTAALIAARLAAYFKRSGLPFQKYFLWTDSQIALHWLRGEAQKWKPYVFNRVKEIQELTETSDWRYCPGKDNPADLVTRGISVKQFLSSTLWTNGPDWLKRSVEEWPTQNFSTCESTALLMAVSETTSRSLPVVLEPLLPYEKFSNWKRLLRITAYILKFLDNLILKRKSEQRYLTATEMNKAEKYWLRYIQKLHFPDEILSLQRGKLISRSSNLLTLNPWLDEEGLLRVGGRLQSLNESLNVVNPIILPKSNTLSKLIVADTHERVLHGGVNTVLVRLREKFWLLSGRQLTKKVVSSCRVCRKIRGRPASQPFAPLPRERMVAERPFETVGVDFAGPLYVNDNEGEKLYILLFTCAVIRAVHLELAYSLSTESCILAFRRFISRRGTPRIIYSDNAKAFKKAAAELKAIFISEEFKGFLTNKRIEWRYSVERAPWLGGYWERLVKSVKDILKVTIWKAKVNKEELHTLLTEAEHIINIRPLTYVSDDPFDLTPLTPESFFVCPFSETIDQRMKERIPISSSELREKWKSRMKYISALWKRWKLEYLRLLRSAHHSNRALSKEVQLGDVVLVYDPATPRIHWRLAIIETCFPGRDNKVRACEVRFADGKRLKRPIQLLYPLEVRPLTRREDVKNY